MSYKNADKANFVPHGRNDQVPLSDCFNHSVQTFYKNRKKPNFWPLARSKIGFSRFPPNLSILEYMLLHNTNINVAIAHILAGRTKLNDRRGRSYKNQ